MILILFFSLGSLVVISYGVGAYLLTYQDTSYDSRGIWAGLQPYHSRWPMYLWYTGELLSCLGFVIFTYLLSTLENDNDDRYLDQEQNITIFYTLFLASALFWMPLAIQGDRFYSATILALLVTSASAVALLAESLIMWNANSMQGWVLLPLALHTTLFDFVFWSWTWNPAPYINLCLPNISMQTQCIDIEDQCPPKPPFNYFRPLFVIEEEDLPKP